jgi:hypothetical protein
MRKRIIIALVAIVAIGVLAFVFSQPKRGTVEYHLRAYRAELDRYHGRQSFIKASFYRVRVWFGPYTTVVTDQEVVAQENALIDLGYMERREFTVTNLSAEHAVSTIGRAAMTAMPGLCRITAGPRPAVVVVAGRREDMAKWEQLVQEADEAARTNR